MRINEDEISIIIPMYNSEVTIVSVLNSICAQSKREYIKEIIIVNDGSKDESKRIVEEYMQISCIPIILLNQKNGGVSKARNIGMRNAKGNWIAFCDSDDLWYKDKIEKQVLAINSKDIDFLGANHEDIVLHILWKKINRLYQASIYDLCIKMFPQTSTVIMKKEIFDTIGGFDETQKYAEDGNYFMKIAAKYKYFYLPEKLVNYGGGKRGFGVSGLSANLKEMHKGSIKNLNEMYQAKNISKFFFWTMRLFYLMKYVRRVLIVKFSK